jgi:hypothetical protein
MDLSFSFLYRDLRSQLKGRKAMCYQATDFVFSIFKLQNETAEQAGSGGFYQDCVRSEIN